MLTVEEALEAILSRVPLLETERVDVLGALGRTLAEPVVARRAIPPWPNSSMDGYAVRAEDTRRGAALAIVGRVEAGEVPARGVGQGEAMRIFTGAPLPEGADTVLPQEDVEATADSIA
ncbi:MAG: molybdopterin molybdenumtransferase MoeA, partial [Candidatus Rokuibacteriota bacterium]